MVKWESLLDNMGKQIIQLLIRQVLLYKKFNGQFTLRLHIYKNHTVTLLSHLTDKVQTIPLCHFLPRSEPPPVLVDRGVSVWLAGVVQIPLSDKLHRQQLLHITEQGMGDTERDTMMFYRLQYCNKL